MLGLRRVSPTAPQLHLQTPFVRSPRVISIKSTRTINTYVAPTLFTTTKAVPSGTLKYSWNNRLILSSKPLQKTLFRGFSSTTDDNNKPKNTDDESNAIEKTEESAVEEVQETNNNETPTEEAETVPENENTENQENNKNGVARASHDQSTTTPNNTAAPPATQGSIVLKDATDAISYFNQLKLPDQVIVVPLYKRPFFPGTLSQLIVDDPRMLSILKRRKYIHQGIAVFLSTTEDNKPITDASQIAKVGTFGTLWTHDGDGKSFFFSGAYRVAIEEVLETDNQDGKIVARVKRLYDDPWSPDDKEIRACYTELVRTIKEIVRLPGAAYLRAQIASQLQAEDKDAAVMADLTAASCGGDGRLMQEVLETLNVKERLIKTLYLLKNEFEISKLQQKIAQQVEEEANKIGKQHLLRQQLKFIKRELGLEKDDKQDVIEKFEERLKKCKVPEYAMKVINEEMAKLSTLETASSEYNLTRNYLDWLTILPWGIHSEENLDVLHAEKVLDEDHYGLKDVKERILEFIAVGQMKSAIQGKILCFAGPPGVGKTSIGKSIARALSRQFFRFSVGGMSDVAEIKGHRRTYIGAMPGKIIQCLKSVKTSNPVILIDEIDKLGKGWHGDPSSALLEVLDPEQNNSFLDHYLDVPFDISKVLFIVTANVKDAIPGPLLDRMEVINLSGYVLEEKFHIASKYLIPTARSDCGLNENQVELTDGAIRTLIGDYCREAGVRNLQKQIEKILRKVAYKVVKQKPQDKIVVDEKSLSEYVGKPVFNSDKYYEITPPGVVMGLAWTRMGGATLYVETTQDKLSNKPHLKGTGQMGDVMKESSSIAYTYSKYFIDEVDPGNRYFEHADLHMHIPEGATPKDGPSAGCTMVTSLMSLALNKSVRENFAMTGELTLTGKVLPIGGVKEKTIAAKRSGVKTVVFPKDNQKDWEELEDYLKEGLEVHFADYYKDVFAVAFGQTVEEARKINQEKRAAMPKEEPKKKEKKQKDDEEEDD